MNLVGELVLARNQVLQSAAGQTDATLQDPVQRINLITGELQESVMRTRMQPIATVWNRLPRVARDLALALGKEVRLTLEGKDTGLDRSIIESIKDPLTHLLRNALDHGIETPEVRRQRGKPIEGHVHLRAYHEGGQVNIEMSDDGGGIDPQRVGLKAVERGLLSREQLGRLAERELLQMIFLPGFSTAEKVTDVSGRGVGMDVVKTNIEKLGGAIDVQSRPGQGTAVRIKIPLTLAIIPALLVTAGGDRYAIPQASLLELVRLEPGEARGRMEELCGMPVYRLRGTLLPVVYLNRLLDVETADPSGLGSVTIVVLQAGSRPFGLVVDEVHDTQEIVVKALARPLRSIPLYAGATILGDGRVALILDVVGLAQRARVVSEGRDASAAAPKGTPSEPGEVRRALLVCGGGEEQRVAIQLSQVQRLEVIPSSAVEWADGRQVVQYRGGLLSLVWLDGVARDGPGPLHVIVSSQEGRLIGLVVGHIFDTVEAGSAVQQTGSRPGLLGSAVIQQRVTDLIDLPALLQSARPDLFEAGSLSGRV